MRYNYAGSYFENGKDVVKNIFAVFFIEKREEKHGKYQTAGCDENFTL